MTAVLTSRKGAALIIVVASMVAASALGAALMSVATSARYERVVYGSTARAYFLAESGAEFVRASTSPPASWTNLSRTYTLANGDRFIIAVTRVVVGSQETIRVNSTGIANPGRIWEARQRVNFEIVLGQASSDQRPDSLYDEDGDFDPTVWGMAGGSLDPRVRQTGPSEHENALDLKGEQGYIYLRWRDYTNTVENEAEALCRSYSNQYNKLGYDVQVKIHPYENPGEGFNKYHLLGISFRLQTNGASFGLSFFRASTVTKNQPAWMGRLSSASWTALRGTNSYVVLWYTLSSSSTINLLRSRRLTTSDNVMQNFGANDWGIAPYSTLLVRLQERKSGSSSQNRIYAFLQGRSVYTNWPDNDPSYAQWPTNAVFPAPLVWDSGSDNYSTTIFRGMTNNYCTNQIITNAYGQLETIYKGPPEIGLHVYYDNNGANKKFYDDFAVFLPGSGLRVSTSQVQY